MLRETASLLLLLLGAGLVGAGTVLAWVWYAAGAPEWFEVLITFGGLGVFAAVLGAVLRAITCPRGPTPRAPSLDRAAR